MNLDLIMPKRQSRLWLGILGVALVGGTGAAWLLTQSEPVESPPVAIAAPTTVTALGRLEPVGEIVRLSAPTSAQETRLQQLMVQEGDRVASGQVIAVLDNQERLQATLQQAEGQLEIARANLDRVRAGAQTGEIQAQRAEIARLQAEQAGNASAQQAVVTRLEAEVQNARLEAQRYESLFRQGAVSESQRDTKQLTYDTTQQQLKEARSSLERVRSADGERVSQARATLDRIAEVRPVDVAAAEAEVQAAIAAVAEARASLNQAYVRSPQAGQILEIHTQPGEIIGSDGVVTLGNTDQMMVVADVYQSDIGAVEVGQAVEITTPVLDQPLTGTVERIGLEVEAQQVINEDPAANIDAKVVEVHIRLDSADSDRVAALTNLQVTAAIQL